MEPEQLKLGQSSRRALRLWLGQETWHTRHALDEGRLYSFVDCLRRDIRTLAGYENALRGEMWQVLREAGWRGGAAYTAEKLENRIRTIATIFEFLAVARDRGTIPWPTPSSTLNDGCQGSRRSDERFMV